MLRGLSDQASSWPPECDHLHLHHHCLLMATLRRQHRHRDETDCSPRRCVRIDGTLSLCAVRSPVWSVQRRSSRRPCRSSWPRRSARQCRSQKRWPASPPSVRRWTSRCCQWSAPSPTPLDADLCCWRSRSSRCAFALGPSCRPRCLCWWCPRCSWGQLSAPTFWSSAPRAPIYSRETRPA